MVSRGSKTRFIGFICMVLVFSAILYIFHETHSELEDYRQSASSCTHHLESISSQLQIVVENKLKLERSLEDEKNEHMKTKEELNARILDEKQLRDKQNLEAVNRYNDLDQTRAALEKEEKEIRDELEMLKTNFTEEKRKKDLLQKNFNIAISQITNLKKENSKLENYLNNSSLQKSNDFPVVQFIPKSNENINATKSTSVTPAINPQAIDGVIVKSSTPMINLEVSPKNESPEKPIENNEANPINQPSMDIDSANELNNVLIGQKETSPPTQESQVGENEPMKAPPRETIIKKEHIINNSEEDKLLKQKNNAYKYDYEQDHFKEDEDDEDMNDFDAREDNQHKRK
ncbi:Hypothetical protein CINCED_3A007100 [Cinara cedri]|uniref:Uncharacterized protein n=1 Tax=Cinara cedri TaxID=506608 RepID=A0A5E4NGY8_9HEMI|nr:Hypothetical protein CINCED_3A007100 [Cinara cedri]